jgi:hypothetical protein
VSSVPVRAVDEQPERGVLPDDGGAPEDRGGIAVALIDARKRVEAVLIEGRGLPLNVLSAQIDLVLDQAGWRRQPEAVTDEQVEAAARSLTGLSERLWEKAVADDDGWANYFRDQARAALIAASQTGGESDD